MTISCYQRQKKLARMSFHYLGRSTDLRRTSPPTLMFPTFVDLPRWSRETLGIPCHHHCMHTYPVLSLLILFMIYLTPLSHLDIPRRQGNRVSTSCKVQRENLRSPYDQSEPNRSSHPSSVCSMRSRSVANNASSPWLRRYKNRGCKTIMNYNPRPSHPRWTYPSGPNVKMTSEHI
jgi:hypothetical protein